jgi:hypothetical protein
MPRWILGPSVAADPTADPDRQSTGGSSVDEDHDMSDDERRRYFERLCELRDIHRRADSRMPTLRIEDVVEYASRLLDDPAALAAALSRPVG